MTNFSLVYFVVTVISLFAIFSIPWSAYHKGTLSSHMTTRDEALAKERAQRIGGKISLSPKEEKV